MKLYIPTSSRNFNCIFSEESISPRSFYGERGFGYSKWHRTDENPYENLIVLYDELKRFDRPDEGFDDYPLVIEVTLSDNDVREQFRQDKSGAFLFDGTIYLNPVSTGIIFFDERQRDIVLSKAEGSLETKLVSIYKKRLRIERPVGQYLVPDVPDAELNRDELERSIRVNKVKGFIYGYHAGALLSVSKDQGYKVKTAQTLLDLASAIHGSMDKKPTPQQRRQLQSVVLQDSSLAHLLVSRTTLDSATVSALIDEIVYQCKWEPSSDSPDKRVFSLYSMILNPSSQEQAIAFLTDEINGILSPTGSKIALERASDIVISLDNTISLPVLVNNLEGKEVAELWVNGVLADNKYQGSIASYRLDLATELTKAVRDNVYKDQWENSSARSYLNALRRNLNGEEFTEKWNDGVLSALASVLMKGDTWDGLRLFLISKGIQDQTMSFAFYGILNGFANLPKDFTNILLNQKDRSSLWRLLNTTVYEAVNGFGIKAVVDPESQPLKKNKGLGGMLKDVVGSITNAIMPKDDAVNEPNEEDVITSGAEPIDIDDIGDLPPDDLPEGDLPESTSEEDMPESISEQPQLSASDKAALGESVSKTNESNRHKYSELWEFCALRVEETTAKKKDDFIRHYSEHIDRVFERNNSLSGIKNGIKAIPSPRGMKEPWTKVLKSILTRIDELEKDESTKRIQLDLMSQPTLWSSLVEDTEVVNYVDYILQDSPIRQLIVSNFKRFHKNYQPGGYYAKRNDSRRNSDVIDHFYRWCISDSNKFERIDPTPENKAELQKVVDFLKNRYPD